MNFYGRADRHRGALTAMAAMSDMPVQYLRQAPAERPPPPPSRAGVFGWLRANLFSSPPISRSR